MNNFLQETAELCICPKCSADLGLSGMEFHCRGCGTVYPVKNGIPELMVTALEAEEKVQQLSRLYDDSAVKHNYSPKSCGYTTDSAYYHTLNILNQWINPTRISGLKILDVGCGTGLMTESLVSGNQVWGVDISASLLEASRDKGIRPVLASANVLPFPNGFFDLVVCMGVMPYYADPTPICRQLTRVVRPSGQIVVSSTTNSWLIRFVRFVKNKLWMKSQLERLYTPGNLVEALTEQGILVTDSCMGYNDQILSCQHPPYPLRYQAMARIAAATGIRSA